MQFNKVKAQIIKVNAQQMFYENTNGKGPHHPLSTFLFLDIKRDFFHAQTHLPHKHILPPLTNSCRWLLVSTHGHDRLTLIRLHQRRGLFIQGGGILRVQVFCLSFGYQVLWRLLMQAVCFGGSQDYPSRNSQKWHITLFSCLNMVFDSVRSRLGPESQRFYEVRLMPKCFGFHPDTWKMMYHF